MAVIETPTRDAAPPPARASELALYRLADVARRLRGGANGAVEAGVLDQLRSDLAAVLGTIPEVVHDR